MKTNSKAVTMENTDTLENMGARLRQAREDAGLSRRALGEMTGLSDRTIEHYERGTAEASSKKLSILAKALNVSISWLYGENDEAIDMTSETISDDAQSVTSTLGTEAEQILDLLSMIDDLRIEGLPSHRRRMFAFIEDVHHLVRYLEPPHFLDLAKNRGLHATEGDSLSILQKLYSEKSLDQGVSKYHNRLDAYCAEILERLVDTAVLGCDLYGVDMGQLKDLAERWEIDHGRIFSGWKGHAEIVPALREKLREQALTGKVAFIFTLSTSENQEEG